MRNLLMVLLAKNVIGGRFKLLVGLLTGQVLMIVDTANTKTFVKKWS